MSWPRYRVGRVLSLLTLRARVRFLLMMLSFLLLHFSIIARARARIMCKL